MQAKVVEIPNSIKMANVSILDFEIVLQKFYFSVRHLTEKFKLKTTVTRKKTKRKHLQ